MEDTDSVLGRTSAECSRGRPVAYRRWALFVRSGLPKLVEYGLAAPEEFDTVERRRRDALVGARGPVPLSWLMIGQWARKPERDRSGV